MKSDDLQSGYEFGPFRLEAARRRLWRGEEITQLRPKAVETLLLLIENRERVVEKEELLAHLWPDTVVEESNLTQYIYLLRKTLSENNGAGDYILTVPGRGYRFVAAVQEAHPNGQHSNGKSSQAAMALPALSDVAIQARDANGVLPQAAFAAPAAGAGRSRKSVVIGGLFVLLLLGAFSGWRVFWRRASEPLRPAWRAPAMTKLFTLEDHHGAVMISADGRLVCYLANHGLWVKELASGKETCVAPGNAERQISGYSFDHDARYVYYTAAPQAGGVLYRVPVGGGASERLLNGINSAAVLFSPDGQRALFRRHDYRVHKTNTLLLADADGKNEEVLAVSESFRDFLYSVWSPDGRKVAYVNWRKEGEKDTWEVVERSLATREQQTLLLKRGTPIRNIAYLPDQRGLLLLANDPVSGARAIWWQPPNAPAQRLTQDTNQYLGLSVTADGNTLVTSATDRPGKIYLASLKDPAHVQPVTATAAYYDALAWRPLNQPVYSLLSGADFNLWQSRADGSAPQQLLAQPGRYNYPAVSPDGQRLVFTARQDGQARLLVREANGSLRSLLELECHYPSFSPDGGTVYFQYHPQGGDAEIWRIAVTGGEPVKVTQGSYPALSPDGKWLAHWFDDSRAQRTLLAIRPVDGKTPVQFFAVQSGYPALRWLPDGSGVAFLTTDEIRLQPRAGGAPKLLLKAQSGELFSFDFSPDGQEVAYIAGHLTTNVILLNDLQASTTP